MADAYPRRLPDLYADRPLVVHARYGHGGSGDVVIRGRIAGHAFEQTVSVSLPSEGDERAELESIWARTRIRDLMTAMALQPNDELQEEVTQLGLQHHLLTQWTAFLAIDEGYRVEGAAQTVHQPSETPAGIEAPSPQAPSQHTSLRSARPTRTAIDSIGIGTGIRRGGGGGGGYAESAGTRSMNAPDLDPLMGLQAAGGSDREQAAPMPDVPAATPQEGTRGDEAATGRLRGRRGPSRCYELARRPDGTIDQAALEDCLRREREGAQKETLWGPPKRR